MPVVGTAGHVDHGKSTLIRALTGRDPDRWKEEKERGLTIDLGFAWTTLGGTEVSFVDVPGHERYSKNMLAGIEAIDVALLVVAADEGWMPQSEEHLAVLDLLGVRHGVVALTKVDRVDADLVGLATLEIGEQLAGTTLENAPIVEVSAIEGTGLEQLRAALAAAVDATTGPETDRPRLWVDRVFSAAGAGTIATGTLLGGWVAVDDRLRLEPAGVECRVRGIQSHERDLGRVEPRRRVALNLAGVDIEEIDRGSMLGRPGEWRTTTRVAVDFGVARYVTEVPARGAYHLHAGSGAWPVRFRQMADSVAVLDLSEPLPLAMGDRFILRDTGRRMVVAGGRVLDPSPPRSTRLRPHLDALRASLDGSPNDRAIALLAVRGRDTIARLDIDSGGGEVPGAVVAGRWAMTAEVTASLLADLERRVAAHHDQHPLRPGLPSAEAGSRLGIEPEVLGTLVDRSPTLQIEGSHVRLASFAGVRSDEQERAWARAREQLSQAGPGSVPRVTELELGIELVHALVREGELVRVSDDFVYLPSQVESLLAILRSISEPFTVSDFKDRSALSRKYAVPFLEWADRSGHTVRQGDTRRLR
jgi:selenocysteine-specific elongation factor